MGKKKNSSEQDNFLALISHELYTPLTAIINAATLLEDQADAEVLAVIQRNASRLQANIEQLLQLSRAGTTALRQRPVELDLDSFLRQFHQELQAADNELNVELGKAKAKIVLDIEADLPTICGDPQRLRQVLMRLVQNALKFSDPAATPLTIKLSLQLSGIDELPSTLLRPDTLATTATFLTLKVAANAASSIPLPTNLEDLFKPFTGAMLGGDIRLQEGLGVSLALARQTLEAHAGYLWAQQQANQSAEFILALPILSRLEELDLVISQRLWSGPGKQKLSLLLLRPAPGSLLQRSEQEELRRLVQSALFRASDTVVWLGESAELVVLLEDCDATSAERIAARIVKSLEAKLSVSDYLWAIVTAPSQGAGAAELLATARSDWRPI